MNNVVISLLKWMNLNYYLLLFYNVQTEKKNIFVYFNHIIQFSDLIQFQHFANSYQILFKENAVSGLCMKESLHIVQNYAKGWGL